MDRLVDRGPNLEVADMADDAYVISDRAGLFVADVTEDFQ